MVGVADVREVGAAVAELARTLEPDAVALPDVLPMWEAFDRISRHAETAKLLLTARVDESRAAQRSGHRDTAELLAKKAGTSTVVARDDWRRPGSCRRCPRPARRCGTVNCRSIKPTSWRGRRPSTPVPNGRCSHGHRPRRSRSCARTRCGHAPPARTAKRHNDGSTRPGSCAPGPTPRAPGTCPRAAPWPTGTGSCGR